MYSKLPTSRTIMEYYGRIHGAPTKGFYNIQYQAKNNIEILIEDIIRGIQEQIRMCEKARSALARSL